ncbi:hypothetical protein KSP39_PZI021464 [Platanthera zijinensis]|uniref:Uncharacterized protein n=1 Tax=Platanthera zijinensis TaxID=2320716 RepID=A0AAP0AXG6_9ASPA
MEEEFDEEEVWATVVEKKGDSPKTRRQLNASFSSHSVSMRTTGSNVFAEQGRCSAPVNIPSRAGFEGGRNADHEEEDDEEEEEKIPPHELLARKMARSQISSSSVCEGAGRTLKGRDQRKVRDAVLTKTGFLE